MIISEPMFTGVMGMDADYNQLRNVYATCKWNQNLFYKDIVKTVNRLYISKENFKQLIHDIQIKCYIIQF